MKHDYTRNDLDSYKLDDEFAVTHNDATIHLDGTATRNDINMDFGIPVGTCKFGIWITEGNMQAGHFLIL